MNSGWVYRFAYQYPRVSVAFRCARPRIVEPLTLWWILQAGRRRVPSRSVGQLPNQLIAYQANTLRGDKFSDAGIGQNFELGLARLLEARGGTLQIFVGITGVAHEFGGAFGQIFEQVFQAFAGQDAGLRDAAEIIGGYQASVVGHFASVSRQQLQATRLNSLFQENAGVLVAAGG